MITLEVPMNKTILLTDDDDAFRGSVKLLLELEGFCVIEACNGKEALKLLQADDDEIDVVISDILMPEMAGTELCRNIRLIAPTLKVIGMTGGGLADELQAGSSSGVLHFDRFLKKPFKRMELLNAISEVS
jgi:CheY-like chemotaxis protein